MKRDLIIFVLLSVLIFAVWHQSLFNFFAQDDFIFINHFSQNSFWQDIKNVFGPPQVTHWRPFHNLYFLIGGNLFGKNFIGYHLLTFAIYIATSFFVFKISQILTKSNTAAVSTALFYSVHPAHFVSIFWIAGSATAIGFLFLVASFWSFIKGQKLLSLILFAFALLASEAMVSGVVVFAFWIIAKKQKRDFRFLSALILTGLALVGTKLIFTSAEAFEIYRIEISTKVIEALRYYILRILGFAEISGDKLTSIGLLIFWASVIGFEKKIFLKNFKQLLLPVTAVTVGMFPFILIPSHLSPHYMNISIWGLAMLFTTSIQQLKSRWSFAMVVIFTVVALSNIWLTMKNNWVTPRSNLARTYLKNIENNNPATGTTLVFADNDLSSSKEAYIALGTGEAIKFWFADKNYKTCFTAFEDCLKE